jgi:nitrous oxide reductase accessory protein NosL
MTMTRFVRTGVLLAGLVALAGCSMFEHQQSPQPVPPPPQHQSGPYNNDLHHDYPGPGTTAPNSD